MTLYFTILLLSTSSHHILYYATCTTILSLSRPPIGHPGRQMWPLPLAELKMKLKMIPFITIEH